MKFLFTRDEVLSNFKLFSSWEEKYLYIIELGESLPKMPSCLYSTKNLIIGCQSNVWVYLKKDVKNIIKLYGDSDTLITKGFIAIILIFYNGLTIKECIAFDIYFYLKKISLMNNLTYSRVEGLNSIINYIFNKLKLFI
ncbi:SufE family protein [Candidatus Purcelliella pentastirinorum]|uniref:SufE family protein n=1 Tax=Candidatus Purcelliella pentastirinorum TaxID=472834 RepID=UPI00237B06FE|nr:SufE family protein [Candidatus Purcelliella pentastirinorum]WDR80356.1 SufE family protein [Candidatus Purcelliella pentastirinorum]